MKPEVQRPRLRPVYAYLLVMGGLLASLSPRWAPPPPPPNDIATFQDPPTYAPVDPPQLHRSLKVYGDVTLGDAATDTITVKGNLRVYGTVEYEGALRVVVDKTYNAHTEVYHHGQWRPFHVGRGTFRDQ